VKTSKNEMHALNKTSTVDGLSDGTGEGMGKYEEEGV